MSCQPAGRIADNVARVRNRMAEVARANGRSPDEVRLIGVTKYVDSLTAGCLVDAGVRDVGESRPRVLREKRQALTDRDVAWHLIGSLQRNKVARTLPVADLIHSVDSLRLAAAIGQQAAGEGATQDVLLQVNISGESAKHGFQPATLIETLPDLLELPGLRICGWMGMAGLNRNETDTRNQFAELRELREGCASLASDRHPLNELSMGMSGDYLWAIAEGATMVRIGSLLFEGSR